MKNVAQIMEYVFEIVEIILSTGEKASVKHLLLFSALFLKGTFSSMLIKVPIAPN